MTIGHPSLHRAPQGYHTLLDAPEASAPHPSMDRLPPRTRRVALSAVAFALVVVMTVFAVGARPLKQPTSTSLYHVSTASTATLQPSTIRPRANAQPGHAPPGALRSQPALGPKEARSQRPSSTAIPAFASHLQSAQPEASNVVGPSREEVLAGSAEQDWVLVGGSGSGSSGVGSVMALILVSVGMALGALGSWIMGKNVKDVRRIEAPYTRMSMFATEGKDVGEVSTTSPPQKITEQIYVINGFYMAMREKYTKAGASIAYYLVEWDSSKMSWADFRGSALGATDPATAEAGAIRRVILDKWEALGLKSEPNIGDNGVHASASPFEAMAERLNWIGATVEDDEFGQAMLAAGIPKTTIMEWTKDPQVEFEGKKQSLFDLLEDLDCADCLKKAQVIAEASGPVSMTKNMAYVFIKPHAVTPAVKELVESTFAAKGFEITSQGVLESKTIKENLLIDNHYYAIANKASLTKPQDLNPPAKGQDEFKELFGILWTDALAKGLVFNAIDACAKLGIDGDAMDTCWGASKKDKKLVKLGGGFYAGLVTAPATEKPAQEGGHVIKNEGDVIEPDPEEMALQQKLAEHQMNAAKLDDATEVRTLVQYNHGYAVVSTNSAANPGFPEGSVVGFAVDSQGRPLFAFSGMSGHTQDIMKDSRVSLTVAAKDFKGAADGRVSLRGTCEAIRDEGGMMELREVYLAKHPEAFWVDFGDFTWFRMEVEDARFIGGFARAGKLTGAEYAAAKPDPIAEFSSRIAGHMNEDHEDATRAMVAHYCGIEVESAQITTLDALGMYVKVKRVPKASDQPQEFKLRLPYIRPAENRGDVKTLLVEMTKASAGAKP